MATFQGGKLCPAEQPEWSAFRDPAFGHGVLTLLNETAARWEWHSNWVPGGGPAAEQEATDSVYILRGGAAGSCQSGIGQ